MDLKPSKLPYKALSLMLAATLCTGTALSTAPTGFVHAAESADTSASKVYVPPSLGKISLSSTQSIELKDVHKHGNTVRFSVTFSNSASTDLNFIDYWVKLRSGSGSEYSVSLVENDKTKTKIAPKSSETYEFYATIGENTKLTDLVFHFIEWDFNLDTFERSLGTLRVPATYKPITPSGSVRSMNVSGVSAHTSIKKVNTAKTDDKFVANLTFVFENMGAKSFIIPNYEFAIVTSEGLSYPLTVNGLKDGESLHPRFKKEITLKGELPASVSKDGWQLMQLEKRGELPAMPAASYELPQASGTDVVNAIPTGGSKEVIISDQKILASVDSMVRNENDKNYLATIRFTLTNQGQESVTLPKYLFKIRTSAGLTYPMTINKENLRLDPLVEQEIELKATVPNTVSGDNWTLLMEEAVDDNTTSGDFVASFALPDGNASGLNQGVSYDYSNDDGTYSITFDTVQRLPWEDQDILSAEFVIKNNGISPLPIPDLMGHFELDNKIKIDAKMVEKDTVIALQPGTSVRTVLYGKIPYTYEYSSIKLALEEQLSEDTVANVVEFTSDSSVTSIPVISLGSSNTIQGAGRAASVSMRSVRTYDANDGGHLYTALVDVTNLEKRFTNLATLVGHFRTANGLLYPVEFSKFSGKVSPQATATLLASSSIPKGVDLSGMQLVLGEGITDDQATAGGDAEAYMNAVAFALPTESGPKQNALDLELFPYTVSLSKINAHMDTTESFIFSFDYELERHSFVENSSSYSHELVVEFVDNNDVKLFSETYKLGADDSKSDDNQLELGEGSKVYKIDDPTLLTRLTHVREFGIRIYDRYEGVKKQIAAVPYNWYGN